jgi:hypothetical protein
MNHTVCRVVLEKLSHSTKKGQEVAIFGNRRIIALFTEPGIVPYCEPDESIYLHIDLDQSSGLVP